MAQTNDEIIQIIDSIYRGDGRKAVKRLNETIDRINYEARLATLDDCKTLIDLSLKSKRNDFQKILDKIPIKDIIQNSDFHNRISHIISVIDEITEQTLAELEALKLKYLKAKPKSD